MKLLYAEDERSLSEAVVDILAYCCGRKKIALFLDVQSHVFLQVHRDTFSQMISILLDNAVKYTPEGGIIRFSVAHESGHVELVEENTCKISADSGPERFFKRFYRGNSARTQDGTASGYGIGLFAARTIAETFGGRLKAEYTKVGTIRFIARFSSNSITNHDSIS